MAIFQMNYSTPDTGTFERCLWILPAGRLGNVILFRPLDAIKIAIVYWKLQLEI